MKRSQNSRRRLLTIKRRANQLGARRDHRIDSWIEMLQRVPHNDGLAQAIMQELDDYEETDRRNPNYLAAPPFQEDLFSPRHPPDFVIGRTTETDVPYGPRIVQSCGSIVVTGIPGGGKTTVVTAIVLGLLKARPQTTIIQFDLKTDGTCFASLDLPNVHVHKVQPQSKESLKFNLLKPPAGAPRDAWLATLADHLCAFRGLRKSRHILLKAMKAVCRIYGVDKDPSLPWPSLINVLEYLRGLAAGQFGKRADYLTSLLTELEGLIDDMGDILNTSDGVDISGIVAGGGLFVIQMETLPVSAQQFLISVITEFVVREQVAKGCRNKPLDVLLVIDEAQVVFGRSADQAASSDFSPLAIQAIRDREFGVSFIIVAHLLSDISRAVLATAKTMYIVGSLSDELNINIAGAMMHLPMIARTVIPRLGQGQMLVREIGSGVTYNDAFLVDIDYPLPIAKDCIDEPTRRRLMAAKLAQFPSTPSIPLNKYPSAKAEIDKVKEEQGQAKNKGDQKNYEAALLLDCVHHRDSTMGERQDRLGIKDYKKLVRIAKVLEGNGWIRMHDVRLGRGGYVFLEVTDDGWQKVAGGKRSGYTGRGGFLHTVLIARVAEHLKSTGWTNVRTEMWVGVGARHAVDIVGCSPGGFVTAFEITLSFGNVASNVMGTLAHGGPVQELIFLCKLEKDCRKVEKTLKKDPSVAAYMPLIEFRRVDEFS